MESDVKKFIREEIKPILREELEKHLNYEPVDMRKELIKKLDKTLGQYKDAGLIEEKKHIEIDVTATPEQIESHQFTVTMTALTPEGEEILKDWTNAG